MAAQPTVVVIDVDQGFQDYSGGVYQSSTCDATTVNHAVVAVGYSVQGGWWKLRNSWGRSWGEAGYIRVPMLSNAKGFCGMYLFGGWFPSAVA